MTVAPGAGPGHLPPPRTAGRYSVALVCLGNICRSPMAHVVLEAALEEAGLADRVRVASSGTGDWHVGAPMDTRAAATLTAAGYDATRHRAQQYAAGWAAEHDLVLAMDAQNLADIAEISGLPSTGTSPGGSPGGTGGGTGGGTDGGTGGGTGDGRLRLFRDLDPRGPGRDVPDPYYGGDDGFEEVLSMVQRTSTALVAALADLLGPR